MNIERPLPYIGISGVSQSGPENISAQSWLIDTFRQTGLDSESSHSKRQLLLGVKAVHKTQYLDIANKYGRDWYPVGEAEFEAALGDGGADGLKAAQIYFDNEHAADGDYRDDFVRRICARGKVWLNALQFDLLPWQQNGAMLPFVEKVKQATGHEIILQAHGESMRQLGPDGVVRILSRYAHAIDYILFDASHGKGVRMDPESLMPFLDAAHDSTELAGTGIGVAGGLCAEVVRDDLLTLLEAYPDLSWDAEGRLHGDSAGGGLDWAVTRDYIQASANVLHARKQGAV